MARNCDGAMSPRETPETMGFLMAETPTEQPSEIIHAKAIIQSCLDHAFFEDALFMSELLFQRVTDDDVLLLLCESLIRLLRFDEVYSLLLLNPKSSSRVRYVFAKCCYDLKKYDECENTLMGDGAELHDVLKDSPSASFARILLSSLCCKTARVEVAQAETSKAISDNPFIWSGISKYIQVGGRDVSRLISETQGMLSHLTVSAPTIKEEKKANVIEETVMTEKPILTTKKTPSLTTIPKVPLAAPRKSSRLSEVQIPTVETRRSSRARLYSQDVENAGGRGTRHLTSKIGKPAEPTPRTTRSTRDIKQPLASRNANAMRSLSSSSTSVASNSASASASTEEEKVKKTRTMFDPNGLIMSVLANVKELATIEEAVGSYNWQEAQRLFATLSWPVAKQPVALLLRARIMLELSEYTSAKDILLELRKLHPYRIEGVELLSTAMWQLQDNYGLSSLAQELTSKYRRRPQTWCVAGNCYSLQRQHSQAVECMQRSIQIDPHFAYAYTLLGHELVSLEELDKAAQAFRSALSISPYDYRALYGLSQVHQRNEEMGLAQHNLLKALAINPTNRAMLCASAQVEQALNNPENAMHLLNKALVLNPNDVACRYNRARLLFDMKKNEECLEELEKLKGLSPDEAHIFHLLGKVHRRLGNHHLALLNYSWATEMDPRGEQMMMRRGEDLYDDDSYSPDYE